MESKQLKYGRVVLMGRPNTGKSTLLNAIMNQKVAITSPLPQTTRKSHRVVYSDDRGKIIFIDTPGIINKVEDLVSKSINTEAPKEVGGKDVIVCLVDISRPKSEEENKVIGLIRKAKAKKILVYNKIDKAVGPKDHLADYNYLEEEFDKTLAVSALKRKHVRGLINEIFRFLPIKNVNDIRKEAEQLESGGVLGMDANNFVAEIIREKAYLFLRKEVPYTINVEVNKIEDKKEILVIGAQIYTNNDRYKKIIIGMAGSKIREIGYNARKELEIMTGRKVFLELEVKKDEHWMEKLFKGE